MSFEIGSPVARLGRLLRPNLVYPYYPAKILSHLMGRDEWGLDSHGDLHAEWGQRTNDNGQMTRSDI